eukprot:SM000076S21758  [mRNA]  locus=s76:108244:109311:+ [translate_table: standard]
MRFRAANVQQAQQAENNRRAALLGKLPPPPQLELPPPTVLNTLGGALVAGGIGFVLWNFTTTVENGFAEKAVSSAYTVRNLTITVRTIITGLLYLATFVFAANSLGLTLYAAQLALGMAPEQKPGSPPPSDVSKGQAEVGNSTKEQDDKESRR